MAWKYFFLVSIALGTMAVNIRSNYSHYRVPYKYNGYPQHNNMEQKGDATYSGQYINQDMTLQRRFNEGPIHKRYSISSEQAVPFETSMHQEQTNNWDWMRPQPKTYHKPTFRQSDLSYEETVRIVFPEIPKECLDKKFCEDIPDYPQEYIDYLLARNPQLKKKFVLDTEISGGPGPGPENIQFCRSDMKVVHPLAAKNIAGKWVFIINNTNKPLQGLHGDVCRTTGEVCNPTISLNYESTCKQRYAHRRMWTVANITGEVKEESVSMPSCCMCYLQNEFDVTNFHS